MKANLVRCWQCRKPKRLEDVRPIREAGRVIRICRSCLSSANACLASGSNQPTPEGMTCR